MSDRIEMEAILQIPCIQQGDNIGQVIIDALSATGCTFQEKDVLCVASKVVSIADGLVRTLSDVQVSEVARRVHAQVPQKDARVIQVIIDETGASDGSRIDISGNHIGGWLPNGNRLTSAGVDKKDAESVYLLPPDADASARAISKELLASIGVNVGVIITDSDGRIEKTGATQVAIGVYGISPLRRTETVDQSGNKDSSVETVCDMMAAASGITMGQRGTNHPVVVLRGYDYTFNELSSIKEALSRPS